MASRAEVQLRSHGALMTIFDFVRLLKIPSIRATRRFCALVTGERDKGALAARSSALCGGLNGQHTSGVYCS